MREIQGLKSVLPPEMEARPSFDDDDLPPPVPARSSGSGLSPELIDRTTADSPAPPSITLERTPSDSRPSTISHHTIRSVTPDPTDDELSIQDGSEGAIRRSAHKALSFESASIQSSPRSIPGGGAMSTGGGSRRRGVVFNDNVGSFDSTSSSPPPRHATSTRPRTHTMDSATVFRQQLAPAVSLDMRHRMGSYSSGGSLRSTGDEKRPSALQSPPLEIYNYTPSVRPSDVQGLQGRASSRDKKQPPRRLTKRPEISRPTSPTTPGPPYFDALTVPVPAHDTNRMLLAMKTLCGRMRGEIEYQTFSRGIWYPGVAYIDEERGSMMFESGENGPFHIAIVPDLRGCRVQLAKRPDSEQICLEIASPDIPAAEITIRPFITAEVDLWVAALLCWQQMRPANIRFLAKKPNSPANETHDAQRRGSASKPRDGAIIKTGKILFWDKGLALSPRSVMKRPSTRDLRSPQTSWRKVTCMLQGHGEFRLMTINEVSCLCVIELSQLSRSAIQQLDRSVLEEQFCIAIYPHYASTATQLSIFRPIFIALESRVLFETWLVLLRAFTIPELYGIDLEKEEPMHEVVDLDSELPDDIFRVEKTLNLRLTEAKIRNPTTDASNAAERHFRQEYDGLTGHYLSEVLLDSEVRGRTTVKADTKNPFWREDWEFADLPPSSLPSLATVVKRVDGNLDVLSQSLHSSSNVTRYGIKESFFGSAEVALGQLELGKDHEQWHQIFDDRQRAVGSVLLRIHHEELVVLLSRDYQPLADLLLRPESLLAAQVASQLPHNSRRVAEALLNIFQVPGKASEWLMALVEEEIDGLNHQANMKLRFADRVKSNDSADDANDRVAIVRDLGRSLAGEANLLFRGNSLLTQALECHMRRLGKDYLEEVLAAKIFEINQINPECELDPAKVHSAEELQKNFERLMQFTEEVWACITKSAYRLPSDLRHILKFVRAVAEDRYGDFLRTVAYTSVSGFLFLRFICPAILNPKLFGLLRDHPRPRAQRALTLIAKTLQALANLSNIGKKEAWMEPMNRFINGNRKSVREFLDAVCAIPADTNPKAALQPAYAVPIATLETRLKPIAREGFGSIPYLIDHSRNFAILVKMWAEAHPPDATKAIVFEGELEEFNRTCLDLHRRTEECTAHLQTSRAAAAAAAEDTASQIGSELADLLEHASLSDTMMSGYGAPSISSWPGNADLDAIPPGSSGSEFSTEIPHHLQQQHQMSRGMPAAAQRPGAGAGAAGMYPPTAPSGNGGAGSASSRQASGSAELLPSGSSGGSQAGTSLGGTVRGLRNGKHARKFLSGFITRKARPGSPDAGNSGGSGGGVGGRYSKGSGKERDSKEKDRDRPGYGFGESWGSGSVNSGSDVMSRFS